MAEAPIGATKPPFSLQIEQQWGQAAYDHARALFHEGKYNDSANTFKRIETQYKGDAAFIREEAYALTASCKPENVAKSIQLLETQVKNGTPDAQDYSALGQAYGRGGRYRDTLTAYTKALELDPNNATAQIITVPEGDQPLQERRKLRADELHKRGQQLLIAKHKPLEALYYYEAAIALTGVAEKPWSVFDKGKALAELGHTDQAIQALQQSRFLMPNETWPSSQLGIVYEKAGKLELARELFYEALEKDKGNQEAIAGMTRLGISHEVLKQLKDARSAYREALKREGGNQEARKRLEAIGNVNELGLLHWDEHEKRRSETLRMLPDAELDERYESQRYVDSFSKEYRDELSQLDAEIGRPMDEKCRAAIVIPAFHEGRIIKHSLEHFLNQTNNDGNPLDPSLFEIVVVDNHPSDKPKDNTEDEIRAFQSEHREVRVSYLHKVWGDNEGCVGNARRYGLDLATMRGLNRTPSSNDLFLVNNDADIYGISPTYIATIIDEFDKNPKIDAVTGKWTLSEKYLENPNLKAAQRMKYILDLVTMANYVPGKDRYPTNPPKLQGKSSAFRTAIYAGVGGMNQYAMLAEDLEVGWMIRNARGWNGSTQKFVSGRSMEMVSDPRRFLAVMSEGIPLANMYEGFHEDTHVREMDNDELFAAIPKNFDRSIIEREADALWQKQNTEYSSQKGNFYSFFDRTMHLMGLEYEIVDTVNADGEAGSHIHIVDTSHLERSLKQNQRATHEETESATPTGEVSPFPSEERARKTVHERQKEAHQLQSEGKTVLEIRQAMSNDYSTLEDYYRERVGVDLIADPYSSEDHAIPLTKKCSLVLPAYNRSDQLIRSLLAIQESSFNAKYPSLLEVVIVDDGSTKEDIAQAVKNLDLQDLNIKVFRQTNGRAGKARYSGALHATGDIIIFTDPDIVYSPTMIEEYMKKHEVLDGIVQVGLRNDIDMDDPRFAPDVIKKGGLAEIPYNFNGDYRVVNDSMVDSDWLKKGGHNTVLPLDTDNHFYGWDLASIGWSLSVSAPRNVLLTTKCGYDPRYVGWGYEDENMMSELIAEGLYVLPNTGGLAFHQRHESHVDESKRLQNQQVYRENINNPPRRQNFHDPEPTDASLIFEISNPRSTRKEPGRISTGDEDKRAWTLMSMGLTDEALQAYEKTFPDSEGNSWLQHDYAKALTATCTLENVKKAVEILEQVVAKNPSETWMHSSLAIAYGRSGEYGKALQAYQTALRLYPDNWQAKILEGAEIDPQGVAGLLHEKGARLFLDRGKPREALRFLEAALAIVGEESQPWSVFDKGKALFQMGLFEEAEKQLHRAGELLPGETWPFSQLASIYEARGEKEKAKDFYEQALSRWPENNEARQGLARLEIK